MQVRCEQAEALAEFGLEKQDTFCFRFLSVQISETSQQQPVDLRRWMVQFRDFFDQFDKIRRRRGFQVILSNSFEPRLDRNFAKQMKFSPARKRQQQIAMKEQVKLPGETALWPEGALRHRLNFAAKIREPGQNQTAVGIPDPA